MLIMNRKESMSNLSISTMQKLLYNLHPIAPDWSFFQVHLIDCMSLKNAVQFSIMPKRAATNRRSQSFQCAKIA